MNAQATITKWAEANAALGPLPFDVTQMNVMAALRVKSGEMLEAAVVDMCRLAMLQPMQARRGLVGLAGPVQAACARALIDETTSSMLLALADAWNVLACVGAIGAEAVAEQTAEMRAWLPLLAASELTQVQRMRLATMAMVVGDMDRSWDLIGMEERANPRTITPEVFDTLAPILARLILAPEDPRLPGIPLRALVEPALDNVVRDQTELLAANQLDEPTLLWLAHFVFATAQHNAVADVAAELETLRCEVIDRHNAHQALLEERRRNPPPPPLPPGELLANGHYRVDHQLCGSDQCGLWQGRNVATGAAVVVTTERRQPNFCNVAALQQKIERDHTGSLPCLFAGTFDPPSNGTADLNCESYWGIVEAAPPGEWLPHLLPTVYEPQSAARVAIQLGVSLARHIAEHHDGGITRYDVIPQTLWAQHVNDTWLITGYSTRYAPLYNALRLSTFHPPLTLRRYTPPGLSRKAPYNEAVMVYVLAALMSEWATGRYLLDNHRYFGHLTVDHLPVGAQPRLAAVLATALVDDATQRPRLATFVNNLETLLDQW
jgi:hypothetical protein